MDISLKQVVSHSPIAGAAGAAIGAVGGAIAVALGASVAQIWDEAVEQIVVKATKKNTAQKFGIKLLPATVEKTIETGFNIIEIIVEQKLDKAKENREINYYLLDAGA